MTENVAVVVGASRGLGLEWVRQLLESNWTVIACARQPDAAEGLAKLLVAFPDSLTLEQLDVTDFDAAMAVAKNVAARVDAVRLLVNNAGIDQFSSDRSLSAGPLPVLEAKSLLGLISTNTVGPVMATKAFAPLLAKAGASTVVNVSSRLSSLNIASSGSDPYAKDYGYRLSKSSLNMATILMADELAPQGTIVVSMSPGFVITDMTGAHADITVEESVTGQLATTLQFRTLDSGWFFAHTGERIPW